MTAPTPLAAWIAREREESREAESEWRDCQVDPGEYRAVLAVVEAAEELGAAMETAHIDHPVHALREALDALAQEVAGD